MRVAIIGGGITGLCCSAYLADNNISSVVFESDKKAGGLARGFNSGKWKWNLEVFYHHIFTNDKDIFSLAKKVNAKILIKNPITSSFLNSKEVRLDSPLSLLRFSQLSLWSRLRMGVGLFVLKIIPNGLFLERYKAVEALPRLIGREGYELIWEKLLSAKFGPYVDVVNLAWFWSRVAKRTKNLGYFEGGFDEFVEKLETFIEKNGGEIRLNTVVKKIKTVDPSIREDDKLLDNKSSNKKIVVNGEEFDAVVVTTPAPIAEKLIKGLKFPKLNYLWGQTLILEISRKVLSGYWLNILENNFPFLVAVEHTNMIDKKMYGNNRLLYLGNYLPDDNAQLNMTKVELLKLYLPFIKKINNNFDKKLIKNSYLFRKPFAQPVFPVNYSKHIPSQKITDNVYLANMSMVYPFDRGTNYAVKMGREVAEIIAKSFKNHV